MTVAIQTAVCARCGRSTTVPQLLRKLPQSLRASRKDELACPRCFARANATLHLVLRCCYGVMAIAFFISPPFGGGILTDASEATVDVFLWAFLFEPTMIVLHEAAHAAVGQLASLRVFGVHIGSGPVLFRIGGRTFFVVLHVIPAGGLCLSTPTDGRNEWWRIAAMVAAGPLVHLATVAALIAVVWSSAETSFKAFFTANWISVLFWINALMLLHNLIPHDLHRDGQTIPNDGKKLLQLLRTNKVSEQRTAALYHLEARSCIEGGHPREARAWLDQAPQRGALSFARAILELTVLAAEKKWSGVRAEAISCRQLAVDPLQRAAFSAWAAVATVYLGGNLWEAEEYCTESMAVEPWAPNIETVRALVSLALGRDDEAADFLKQAGTASDWAPSAAAAHMWAEIYRRKGNARRQRKWESRASTLDPAGAFRVPAHANSATV